MSNTGNSLDTTGSNYKWWVIIAVCWFGIGIALGLTAPDITGELLTEDLTALEELGTMLGPFQFTTAVFIFLKNVFALLFSFVFSPIILLVPILALLVNGWVLSFVSAIVVQEESFGYLLGGILPHGIIEIPALIIGEAAALSFGILAITALFSKKQRSLLLPGLKRNLRFLLIACILLIPAAIIETYLTPLFLT